MGILLVVILWLILLGGLPRWPHSREWTHGPSGATDLVPVAVLVPLQPGHRRS